MGRNSLVFCERKDMKLNRKNIHRSKREKPESDALALRAAHERWKFIVRDTRSIRILIIVSGLLFGIVAGLEILGYPLAAQSVGFIIILYLPGWFFSLIIFPYRTSSLFAAKKPRRNDALDPIERTTFSVMFSMVITSAVVYLLHVGTALPPESYKLNPRNFVYLMSFVLLVLAAVALFRQKLVSFVFVVGMTAVPFIVYGLHSIADLNYHLYFVIPEVLGLVFANIAIAYMAKGSRR
jgi:hypothetical protein